MAAGENFRHAFIGIVMSIKLAPDIEAGLRAEAAARGMDVDALIATAVKAYLRNAGEDEDSLGLPVA
jgi:hypothetical protein